jgi:RND family efflux transporter MFP subunit
MRSLFLSLPMLCLSTWAGAETLEVAPHRITEWKSVYGQVETRDRIPARTRIGGTVVAIEVTEGDPVQAGQRIAMVEDDKLTLQIDALEARLTALAARLATARSELARGEQLFERGVLTKQRLEALRTDVDVIAGEVSGLEADRQVVRQQIEEGAVLAPESGIVLAVPVSRGSVVGPGETVAETGSGGVFLRLAVPERHAGDLAEGDPIEIGGPADSRSGTLVKLYPQIEGGRVQADVEVEGLDARFVGRRVPVRLPVAERQAILVPEAALSRHGGLDFVTVAVGETTLRRVVVPGAAIEREGATWREILTGLEAGDMVVIADD